MVKGSLGVIDWLKKRIDDQVLVQNVNQHLRM